MDDFSIWSEAGMEYEFEKKINEELEMQVLDALYNEEVKELLEND